MSTLLYNLFYFNLKYCYLNFNMLYFMCKILKEVFNLIKISYEPLEILLIKEGKNRKYLQEELLIAPGTLAKIAKREYIALSVIERICDHFDVPIQDVVEFVRVDEDGNEIER